MNEDKQRPSTQSSFAVAEPFGGLYHTKSPLKQGRHDAQLSCRHDEQAEPIHCLSIQK